MCGHLGWRIKIEATLLPYRGQINGVLASKGLLWAPLGGGPGCQEGLGHATPHGWPTPAHPPAPAVGLGGRAGDLDKGTTFHHTVGRGGASPQPALPLPRDRQGLDCMSERSVPGLEVGWEVAAGKEE